MTCKIVKCKCLIALLLTCSFSFAATKANDEAIIYYNKGNVKLNLKDYQGAIKDYNEAIKLDPAYKGGVEKFAGGMRLEKSVSQPIFTTGI